MRSPSLITAARLELARLNRPHYVFRPSAAVRRALSRFGDPPDPLRIEDVGLPWHQTISVYPAEDIGRSIATSGVFDPCVTEAIYRLLDPGGLSVDVGANIGYLTNLMATRMGPAGEVLAYEPHPLVFGLLEHNAARWCADSRIGVVRAHQLALSNEPGTGRLDPGEEFTRNMGLAALRDPSGSGASGDIEVELARLDDVLPDREIQLLKVDVEGHEHAVLEGAEGLLAGHRIRDIVFEDHGAGYPTESMALLERHGMQVFTLEHSLLGLRVHPAAEGLAAPGWPGPSYLGTLDPSRSLARLGAMGWRSLALGHRRFRPRA